VVLGLSLAVGCGGSVAGTSATGTSGTGGSGITARTCGMGAPCTAGAKCEVLFIETNFKCDCDGSNHFFCEHSDYGGAGPTTSCTVQTACGAQGGTGGAGTGGPASCSESNGFCTRTCECMGACSDKCDGMGPAQGKSSEVCDEAFCATPEGKYAQCAVKDGACDYRVTCNDGKPPSVTGSCP
jgi:hypothetical protein